MMKTGTVKMGKRHKKGLACVLAGLMLLQICDPALPTFAKESLSENSVSENSISENSVSENSVSENTTKESVSENTTKESVSENTTEESVSENTIKESVSENTTEGSVSENTTEESVSENTTEGSVSENTTEGSVSENTTEESVSENTTEESVSENSTQGSVSANTMNFGSMAAADTDVVSVPPKPTIKSVVAKDTSAQIRFTHLLDAEQAAYIRYEVQIRDEVKGVDLPPQVWPESANASFVGFDGKQLNTISISGLAANKKYSVVLQAKFGENGTPVASAKKTFATKKDMLATDGTMKIRYADMEELKNDRTTPEELPEAGVEMEVGENCALYAQVSRLMRVVETDKLKWAVKPREGSPKNGLKVKASKSTYEAVLTAGQAGSYEVTATNTLSKETVSTFQVTVK